MVFDQSTNTTGSGDTSDAGDVGGIEGAPNEGEGLGDGGGRKGGAGGAKILLLVVSANSMHSCGSAAHMPDVFKVSLSTSATPGAPLN